MYTVIPISTALACLSSSSSVDLCNLKLRDTIALLVSLLIIILSYRLYVLVIKYLLFIKTSVLRPRGKVKSREDWCYGSHPGTVVPWGTELALKDIGHAL